MANLTKFHASYFAADADLKEIHLVEKSQKGFKTLNGANNEARKVGGEVLTVNRSEIPQELLDEHQVAIAAAAQALLPNATADSKKKK